MAVQQPSFTRAANPCSDGSCSVLRLRDYTSDHSPIAVRGRWYQPPTSRATQGLVKYTVRLVSLNDDFTTRAYLEFGIIDAPGAPSPVVFSNCSHCFDPAFGLPPPPGWRELGNHGPLTKPVEFVLAFDRGASRWTWTLDDTLVRWEQSTIMGTVVRIEVGAQTAVPGDGAGLVWHNQVLVLTENQGWEPFEPNESKMSLVQHAGMYRSHYLPDGSVAVQGNVNQPQLTDGVRRGAQPIPVARSSSGSSSWSNISDMVDGDNTQEDHGTSHMDGQIGGVAHDIATSDARVYVSSGVDIIVLGSPGLTRIGAVRARSGLIRRIKLYGDLMLVGTEGGVELYRVTEAKLPIFLGDIGGLQPVVAIACADRRAYVAVRDGTVLVVDIGRPESPSVIDKIEQRGEIRSLELLDDLLLIGVTIPATDGAVARVVVLDVSVVPGAVSSGMIPLSAEVTSIQCGRAKCWIGDAGGRVHLIAVTRDRTPHLDTTLDVTTPVDGLIEVREGLIAVAGRQRIVLLEAIGDTVTTIDALMLTGGRKAMAVADNTVVIAHEAGRVTVVDATEPGHLRIIADHDMVGPTDRLIVEQDSIIGMSSTTLQAMPAFDPAHRPLWKLELTGSGTDISADDVELLVSEGLHGLFSRPKLSHGDLVRVPGSGGTLSTASDGDTLLAASGPAGVRVFRRRSSGALENTGTGYVPGLVQHVVIYDGFAYAATRFDGIHLVDFRDRAAPVDLGRIGGADNTTRLTLDDGILYAAEWSNRIRLFDATSATVPRVYAEVQTADRVRDIQAHAGQFFATAGRAGLIVGGRRNRDVTVWEVLDSAGMAEGLAIGRDRVFVGDSAAGLAWTDLRTAAYLPLVWRP